VADAYGCYMDDVGEAGRALFLIDEGGTIVWSHLSPLGVNPGADGILDALDQMPATESLDVETHSPRKRA
jgi:alkyl hydroperoxide reductase subunit AhpC